MPKLPKNIDYSDIKEIDLHGMNQEQAVAAIETALLSAQNQKNLKMTIITGKGTGALKTVLEEALKQHNLTYSTSNNGGMYEIQFSQNGYKIDDFNINELYEFYENFNNSTNGDELIEEWFENSN
ncbi:Smr/MutS family protein [Mycoplasmopsis iners]|uniref:Smr/MutS family protein n=1 Tax=Mycoplasmopsis iners TaxID=76630 RepID=UPI0004971160|nr:Smr/MutS family protein [Mycoplasmopsis iners]